MTWPMEFSSICLKRIASDKVLADEAFNISQHPNDGYQQALASMI